VDICVGRKAEDVMLFDVHESSILADYYLICTGTSAPHINAICHHLRQDLAKEGVLPRGREGDPASHWVVMDYGSVLIHVLDPERRRFYRIEELWESGHLVAQASAPALETAP
jgi:ribosome-associated protein